MNWEPSKKLEKYWEEQRIHLEQETKRKSIPKMWTELEIEEMIENIVDARMDNLSVSIGERR